MDRFEKMKPAGLVWIAWTIAMLLLLFFCVDKVFGFGILTFEVFVSIVLFFIIVLLLIVLGWILVLKTKFIDINRKCTMAFEKLMLELDRTNKETEN